MGFIVKNEKYTDELPLFKMILCAFILMLGGCAIPSHKESALNSPNPQSSSIPSSPYSDRVGSFYK